MKKIIKFLWATLKVAYFPFYVIFWLLHKIARVLLAIAYFGMLETRMAKDILKYLFNWHGRH